MMDVTSLYLLEANDPTFHLILAFSSGDTRSQPDIHLPRFLELRARLRAAVPALAAGISDTALIVLLAAAMKGVSHVQILEESFANLRLVPGHPEPATEAEREAARVSPYRNPVPEDQGAGGTGMPRRHYDDYWVSLAMVRGMAVPWAQAQQAMAVVDAFHRSE